MPRVLGAGCWVPSSPTSPTPGQKRVVVQAEGNWSGTLLWYSVRLVPDRQSLENLLPHSAWL